MKLIKNILLILITFYCGYKTQEELMNVLKPNRIKPFIVNLK